MELEATEEFWLVDDKNVSTPKDLVEVLEELGYNAQLSEVDRNAVHTSVGVEGSHFPVVLTFLNGQIKFNCPVARLGDLDEDAIGVMAIAALDANTDGNPCAWGILTGSDDSLFGDPKDWFLVAADSMPVGDLSKAEVDYAMSALLSRVMSGESILSIDSNNQGGV